MNTGPAEYDSGAASPVPPGTPRRAPYLAAVEKDPKFKRARRRKSRDPDASGPRYAPVMGLAWIGTLTIVIINLVKGIHGPEPQMWYWHFIADAGVALALLAAISFLWAAWEREERFPELLPKKEFDRRYPPSSAAPPAPTALPYTMTGGHTAGGPPIRVQDLPRLPGGPAPGAPETREFHRRIPYDGQTTMTGGQKLDPYAAPIVPFDSPPPMPPMPGRRPVS